MNKTGWRLRHPPPSQDRRPPKASQSWDEITRGKELEAFQAMSAFFVHDLKNAASTLSLTLQNLPAHFDDPLFRQDVLRGIGQTADRINALIGRLSALRHIELNLAEVDL